MPVCRSCTTEVPAGNDFCGKCGARLGVPDEIPTETALPRRRPAPSNSVDEGRFPPGTLLAQRYRIVSLLGRGGMGEVYRATDLLLGQTVALKFLPPALTDNEAALNRFRGEVKIARLVSHPNVCRVFDIGEAEGLTYLTMEYVDGEDLRSLLHRIGKLPQDKAVQVARKLCAGLAAAHDKGVIHRDLKPANIMLDGEGQVRITDFGLAGFAEQVRDVRSGTPAYMSPEQKAGKEVTARSDIYSLGLVLHEIFTGKRPSEGSTTGLDPLVERAIRNCLDPDPQKRPAGALPVAAALPGGDPLAAALEAGETPSPEMVAAAGERAGISVRAAAICFAVVLTGLVLAPVLGGFRSILRRTPFPNSAEVLTHKAQELVKSFGYAEAPADSACGWVINDAWRQYAERKEKREEYMAQMAEGQPAPIVFWYRQSPRPLAVQGIAHTVSYWDPAPVVSGMVQVELDPRGRLISFTAVPPELEERPSPAAPPDWNVLFRAAAIDPAGFAPAGPQWVPLGGFDTRAAWTGSFAHAPGIPIRVEAASWRGKPVYFEVMGPWRSPWRTEDDRLPAGLRSAMTAAACLVCLLIAVAVLLAWRNWRLGRGDTRGASRVGAVVFACTLLETLFSGHHVSSLDEIVLVLDALSMSLFQGGAAFALYMTLEPWVRRRWPRSLVGWTRLLSDGVRDPMAGAQLLTGCAGGVVAGLLVSAWDIVYLRYGLFRPHPLIGETLVNPLRTAGLAFGFMIVAIEYVLLPFLLFFLLRALLRRQFLVWAGWILVPTGLAALGSPLPVVGSAFVAIVLAIAAFVAIRFGLLPLVVGVFTVFMLNAFPMTADLTAWYAGSTLLALATVLGIAAYSFRTALAGRPLFKEGFLEE